MKKIAITLTTLLTFVFVMMLGTSVSAAQQNQLCEVVLSESSYVYDGSRIEPKITVKNEFGTNVKRSNYTVSYSNNKNVGTATIKVTGLNNYEGSSITKTFKIKPRSATAFSVTGLKVYINKTPKLVVRYNNRKLVEGVDYTYTLSKYSKAGQNAIFTITGKGNFVGKKTVKRLVFPKKVTGVQFTGRTQNSVTIKWNSLSSIGVNNYKVYKCDKDGKNLKLAADVNTNSATISGYKAGEYVYLMIRAYVTVDNQQYFGDFNNVYKSVTTPAKVSNIVTVKTANKDKLKVEWSKVGCTGYEVQYSTDKTFKTGVKSVIVSGQSTTKKYVPIKVTKKHYYSRVRAFRQYKANDKTRKHNGPWSNKLSTDYSNVYASYVTDHVYNPNRTTNLRLACKAINGTIINPGEVFSFNQVVGRRTAAKGYRPATIFTGSSGTSESTGGGICQVASTMFNATLRANFGIVERHQHSQRVHYCPLGRDAAIFWGSEDFKFRNTSNYPIKIEMKCANGKVYCTFKVSYDVKPKKVNLVVNRSGSHFTLKRYVDGKCNYTTHSYY